MLCKNAKTRGKIPLVENHVTETFSELKPIICEWRCVDSGPLSLTRSRPA